MRKILNISLSIILVFSVFALNIAGVINCSASIEGNCCHTSNMVKPCCVKNLKITSDDRLSAHCGCSMKETGQMADLYIELKTSSSNLTSKIVDNVALTETASFFLSNAGNIPVYSPPPVNLKDTYLYNLSLRI